MKTALLVTGAQKWSLNEHTKEVPPRIAAFIRSGKRKFDFVLFSRYVFSEDSPFARVIRQPQFIKPEHTDIMPELASIAADGKVFVRHTFSDFKNPAFVGFLNKNLISRLYVCGFETDGCVLADALEAFDRGLEVYVIGDLCASRHGREYNERALGIIGRNMKGALVNSEKL